MCGEQKSLGEKLGVTPSSIFSRPKVKKFFDDLSDDEEYQNMTEEERNEKMKPKLDLGKSYTFSKCTIDVTLFWNIIVFFITAGAA